MHLLVKWVGVVSKLPLQMPIILLKSKGRNHGHYHQTLTSQDMVQWGTIIGMASLKCAI